MFRLADFAVPVIVIAGLVIKGLATVVLVYIGARLAIRYERTATRDSA